MKIVQESLEDKKIIALDFDGTITSTNEYPAIGSPSKGASFYTNKWSREGFTIIIWTCRYLPEDLQAMREYLRENNIYYDYINENKPGLSFQPFPKIFANIYCDDRNLGGFPGFEKTDKIIHNQN